MKVGDLVRKKVSSATPSAGYFGIVVQVSSVDELPCAKVDFGDYGVFWQRQSLLELLS